MSTTFTLPPKKDRTPLASSPSLPGLLECVTEFYCGSAVVLHDNGQVSTGKGLCNTYWWKQGKRFYFGY